MIKMNMNIQNLMREAQKMQKNLEKTQKNQKSRKNISHRYAWKPYCQII